MTLRPTRDPGPTPRPYRPPVGIPDTVERHRLQGWLGSFGLHLLVVLLLVLPYLAHEVFAVREQRAGAAGSPGGGGGGRGGTGGATVERLYWVPIAPARPAAAEPPPREREVPPPPVAVPPPPVPVSPPPTEPSTPQPTQAAAPSPVSAAAAVAGAATLGAGGGSGTDGSGGSGPGRGGGVGSGVGTGRGTGIGPGTGVGADSIHPPTPVSLGLPPLDIPRRVRPYSLVAYYDVDERGNARLLGFNETSDRGFNKRLRDVLVAVRFRPAVRLDGRPVRDTGMFAIDYP